jgi:hypothetical protein
MINIDNADPLLEKNWFTKAAAIVRKIIGTIATT